MSACRTYREKLVFFVYDELPKGERIDLEAHLKVCGECRKQLAALQKMQKSLPQFSVNNEVLQPTRRALFYKLRAVSDHSARQHSPWWNFGKLALQAGLAIVLVFFGFKLGQVKSPAEQPFAINDLLTASQTISVRDGSISPYLASIDKIAFDPDGRVEITYKTVNSVRIQRKADDPAVQQMLQYALLTDDDQSLRLRAVKTVENLAMLRGHVDAGTLEALQHILNEETNIGVKLAVIDILGALTGQTYARDLLIQSMLGDDNEAVRIQAFKALFQGDGRFQHLEDVLSITKTDTNTYIRTKSLELLNQNKGTSL